MNVEVMRKELLKVYPNKTWETKVKKMQPMQVIAVYTNFLKNDRFKVTKVSKEPAKEFTLQEFEQLTFDDILMGIDWANGSDSTSYGGNKKGPDDES
jgi:hypothetical protein